MAIQPKNDTAIKVDTITEKTTDAGVTIETVTVEDGAVGAVTTLDMTGALTTDTINEHTTAAGVTIEGVELKDSYATLSSVSAPGTPAANEIVLYDASGDLIAKDSAGDTWNLTPSFSDWTPTHGAATGSWTATATAARYIQIGKLVMFYYDSAGASPSSNTDYVTITLPSTFLTNAGTVSLSPICFIQHNGTYKHVATYLLDNTNELRIYSSENFGAFLSSDTITSVQVQGIYEAS